MKKLYFKQNKLIGITDSGPVTTEYKNHVATINMIISGGDEIFEVANETANIAQNNFATFTTEDLKKNL